MTSYELLRWLVETLSRDIHHYRMLNVSAVDRAILQISHANNINALTQSFQIFNTFAIVDPTQPAKNWKISTQLDPTHGSTRPMDNSGWTTFV